MSNIIRKEIGDWFKTYRESYEWPKGSGRRRSEEEIIRYVWVSFTLLGIRILEDYGHFLLIFIDGKQIIDKE